MDPIWAERFDAVWSWQDWPDRPVGLPDTGVDLVARERGTDDIVAVQCKFYAPSASLSWERASTFVAMLSQDVFVSGLLISTAGSESSNFHKNLAATSKDVVIWRVEDFEESLVDWNQFQPSNPTQLSLADRKTLRPHQELAISEVRAGFDSGADRGQLIMACGTGKTFTSLRLAEQVVRAGKRSKGDEDMSPNDLRIPASTDVESLLGEWQARTSPSRMGVVFSAPHHGRHGAEGMQVRPLTAAVSRPSTLDVSCKPSG